MTRSDALMVAAAALFSAVATIGPAVAQDQMQVGLLECTIAPNAGGVPGASKSVSCRFTDFIGIDSEGGHVPNRVDFYRGSIDPVGLDGSAPSEAVAWEVFAPEGAHYGQGALGGNYKRVPARATSNPSVDDLVGGLNGMFALQSFNDQTPTGAALAHRITTLVLVAR